MGMRKPKYTCYKCGAKLKWMEIIICRKCRKADQRKMNA